MRVLCRTFLAFPAAILVLLTLFIVLVLESRRSASRRAGEDLSFQDTQQWQSWRTK